MKLIQKDNVSIPTGSIRTIIARHQPHAPATVWNVDIFTSDESYITFFEESGRDAEMHVLEIYSNLIHAIASQKDDSIITVYDVMSLPYTEDDVFVPDSELTGNPNTNTIVTETPSSEVINR